jgi:hypothetical protein
MSVLGAYWQQVKVGKKACTKKNDSWKRNHGKESVQEESDNWQEAQHVRMQEGGDKWKEEKHTCREGRPNDSRVRVFLRFLCKWLKSPIDINIDTQVS